MNENGRNECNIEYINKWIHIMKIDWLRMMYLYDDQSIFISNSIKPIAKKAKTVRRIFFQTISSVS